MSHQLTSELPSPDRRPGLVIAASIELEPGFRAILLQADRLFRLDIRIRHDTLQTIVRNLSGEPLELGDVGKAVSVSSDVFGDAAELAPGHTQMGFALGEGEDRVEANVMLATYHVAERGTVRVSAQAIVRATSAGDVGPAPDAQVRARGQ
jgi:hypothetical protein